jgi:phospholipid transport system substrate-binding protein
MNNFLKLNMNQSFDKFYSLFLMFITLMIFTVKPAVGMDKNSLNNTSIVLPKAQKTNTLSLVDQSNPYSLVRSAAASTFKRFANEQAFIKVNPNVLKDIVREELMPYVNYKYSAFKVIGKHLKKTTDEERRAFVPVFKEYLITSYAQVFTLYDNQEVEFAPERPFAGKRIVAVNTRIIMPAGENIDVAFKVRLNKKTQQWQAFDMIAEGVSLLDSKQAELGSIIRQKGLPYVTELLKKKTNRDIVFKNIDVNKNLVNDTLNQQG